jgi:hypothetical protein
MQEKLIENAEIFVDHFQDRFTLDYSEGSLALVEEILEEGSDFYEDMEEERKKWLVTIAGSYVFEVGRRNFGGKYFWYDKLNQPILVTGQPDFEISLLAFEKVKMRLENGPEDSIPFFFQGYSERVRNGKPGDKAMIV